MNFLRRLDEALQAPKPPRLPTQKELTDPGYAYDYAMDVIKGRWPEGEEAISKEPAYAYYYIKDFIKGRWPEGEEAISKDSQWAYFYARDIIEDRWPEGEEAISKNKDLWAKYKRFVKAIENDEDIFGE